MILQFTLYNFIISNTAYTPVIHLSVCVKHLHDIIITVITITTTI